MIKMTNVVKYYTKEKGVFGVNLDLEKGNVYGFVGPNGGGKSTILKLIMGLLKPDEGTIEIEGVNEFDDIIKKISFMPDELEYPNVKLQATVDFIDAIQSDFVMDRFNELAEIFNIDLKVKFKVLSKGQKITFRLALALARDTDMYIFDEPLTGIDVTLRKLITDEIIKCIDTTNKIIVISSHELEDIDSLIDQVVAVKDGKVIKTCDIDEITKTSSLHEWYLETFAL